MPNVWEAFVDYRLEAHTFSKQEMAILQAVLKIAGYDGALYANVLGMDALSRREREDFAKVTGIQLAVGFPS